MAILYLNLNKLANDADKFIDHTLERHRLLSKLEIINGTYPDSQEFF